MTAPRPELRRGRIVWARVRDHNHIAKERPVIVLTRTEWISSNEPFEVMAITTTFAQPAPIGCIELPWHPSGKTLTRLRRRSAAVINWVDEIRSQDVRSYQGDVPPMIMLEILRQIDE